MFERINIAVRRKGGGELVTAGSLFTILLSRAQKSVQAAVEEEQHDDHLLREEQLLHKERSNEQSAASLGPASSRRCSTLPAVGPGVPLDRLTH